MRLHLKLTGILATCILCSCGGDTSKTGDVPVKDSMQVHAKGEEMKVDTVNRPELVTANTDGSLHLTAENGKPVGPEIKYMPEWRAFGWFTAADRVEWDLDVNNGGEYEVHLEWSVSDEEAGKEFLLEAKDDKLTGKVKRSGSWETYKTENVGPIKLPAGRQQIIFKSKTKFDKGGLLDLRGIKLVPAR